MNRALPLSIAALLFIAVGCQNESRAPVPRVPLETPTVGNASGTGPAGSNSPGADQGDKITNRWVIESRYGRLNDRRVLRIWRNPVTVTLDIQDVIRYLQEDSAGGTFAVHEKALAERLRNEHTRSEYRYEDFPKNEQYWIDYCLQKLLEQGRFLIKRNDTGRKVPRIMACSYSRESRPGHGCSGTLFLLEDGTEFFRTVDLF